MFLVYLHNGYRFFEYLGLRDVATMYCISLARYLGLGGLPSARGATEPVVMRQQIGCQIMNPTIQPAEECSAGALPPVQAKFHKAAQSGHVRFGGTAGQVPPPPCRPESPSGCAMSIAKAKAIEKDIERARLTGNYAALPELARRFRKHEPSGAGNSSAYSWYSLGMPFHLISSPKVYKRPLSSISPTTLNYK